MAELSNPELGLLAVFWTVALVASYYVEINLFDNVVARTVGSALSFASEQMPLVLSVATVLGAMVGAFKYREGLASYAMMILRKLTKRKRR
jgi:hypothetical protein